MFPFDPVGWRTKLLVLLSQEKTSIVHKDFNLHDKCRITIETFMFGSLSVVRVSFSFMNQDFIFKSKAIKSAADNSVLTCHIFKLFKRHVDELTALCRNLLEQKTEELNS